LFIILEVEIRGKNWLVIVTDKILEETEVSLTLSRWIRGRSCPGESGVERV